MGVDNKYTLRVSAPQKWKTIIRRAGAHQARLVVTAVVGALPLRFAVFDVAEFQLHAFFDGLGTHNAFVLRRSVGSGIQYMASVASKTPLPGGACLALGWPRSTVFFRGMN